MTTSSKSRNNKIRFGFIPGVIIPVIMFVILYIASGKDIPFSDYLLGLWHLQILIKLMTLCVLPNLLLFLYFYRKRMDLAARGVLMATFLYAFIVLLSRVV